jgi:hypothetical protein
LGTDRNAKLITIVAVALLGVFVLQALLSAGQKSPTMDEQNHIARGYAYLRTRDLRLSREHPPLVNAISALPLLVIRPQLPTDHPSWTSANWYAFSDELLWRATDADGRPIEATKIVNWSRVPIVLLGLLLGMGVYAWAAELHGSAAGLLALGLYVFSPNILAHTRLATNDLGLACFTFFALYTFWRFMTGPTITGIVAAGVALGLALAAKFSALILLPIFALLVVIHARRKRPASAHPPAEPDLVPLFPGETTTVGPPAGAELFRPQPVKPAGPPWWRRVEWKWVLYLTVLVIIGLAVTWGIYGLERGPLSNQGTALPMPSYWNGLKTIFERTERGNPAFLMGRYSTTGWWYYFPLAFLIKTPVPTLLSLALALALTVGRQSWRAEMWLLLPVAIYFLALMGSSLNIGYRHLLPVLPLLFVYVSKLATGDAQLTSRHSRYEIRLPQSVVRNLLAVIPIVLVGWQALSALRIYPHYLAYFNDIVGGPENGYQYLVDSNLDWGQDLPTLRDYLDREGIDHINLSWFGPAPPERYGIRYRPLPGFPLYQGSAETFAFNPYQPAPGLYAISATNLQGVMFKDHDTFAWFREQEPLAQPGYSIFIYRVPEPKGLPRTVAIGGVSYRDVETETLEAALARPNTLVCAFDPRFGFVAPVAGETTYIVSDLLPFAPRLRRVLLGQAEVLRRGKGYDVYRLDAAPTLAFEASSLAAANAAWWSPAVDFAVGDLTELRHPVTLPIGFHSVHGTLEFMGYDLSAAEVAPGSKLALITYWHVLDKAPLSTTIFVHLLDPHSTIWAGWDGLDVSPSGWQRGDIVVQYTQLTVPTNASPGDYQVEIGVYTADDGQRSAILEGDEKVADRLLLQPIQVAK